NWPRVPATIAPFLSESGGACPRLAQVQSRLYRTHRAHALRMRDAGSTPGSDAAHAKRLHLMNVTP
ncbi:MAG TPA: hypothetical protein VK201_07285, partial [bacterium]|nr:hypothetical protein [bacterium]